MITMYLGSVAQTKETTREQMSMYCMCMYIIGMRKGQEEENDVCILE